MIRKVIYRDWTEKIFYDMEELKEEIRNNNNNIDSMEKLD